LQATDASVRDECLASAARWLKLAQSYELSDPGAKCLNWPPTVPEHPGCRHCNVPMWLVEIRTGFGKVEYLFQCKVCEETATVTDEEKPATTE